VCKKSQVISQTTTPYITPSGSNYTIPVNATYMTVAFFNSDGTRYEVSGLSGDQVSHFTFRVPNCTAGVHDAFRVVLVFWNETRGDWDTSGVFRDNDAILASGDNCTLIGYATHFTTFTLGSIAIQLNAIDPNAGTRFADFEGSRGAKMTSGVLAGLLATYLLGLVFTLRRDWRDERKERIPHPKELDGFCSEYHRLFQRRVPRRILETRCLDEWKRAYELDDHAQLPHIGFWERLRIHCKVGFRTSHTYVAVFFKPLESYTRTQRLTVLFSNLFVSMCVNALFYQFGQDYSSLSAELVATRFIVGVLTSLIVTVPTFLASSLFRRVRARGFLGLTYEQITADDLQWMALDESYLERRTGWQRTLLDWHVPWWVSPILYGVLLAGWVVSFYFTLLYGISFTYDQANAWLASFAISVATSFVVLQSVSALMSSIASTIFTVAAVGTAVGAVAASAELMAMS
jgi:hypothetical protein